MSSRANVDREAPEDCPFCRIVRGQDQPTHMVWQEDEWLAFFPKSPATPGHTLVVPREHVPHYWALDETLAQILAVACRRVGRAVDMSLGPEGMNLITSRGVVAEQTVTHVHLHILPRWTNDAVGPIWPPQQPADSGTLDRIVAEVRRALRSA